MCPVSFDIKIIIYSMILNALAAVRKLPHTIQYTCIAMYGIFDCFLFILTASKERAKDASDI